MVEVMRVGEGIKGGEDEIGVRYFQSKVYRLKGKGGYPEFVEVDQAGIAVDDAMRRQRSLQPVA
jgi:hypothetical protein